MQAEPRDASGPELAEREDCKEISRKRLWRNNRETLMRRSSCRWRERARWLCGPRKRLPPGLAAYLDTSLS